MKWNSGHLWNIQYSRKDLEAQNFEFKFVIKEGNHICRWEEGKNHTYNLEEFVQRFEQSEIRR